MYFPAHKVAHMGDLFVRSSPFIDYSAGGSSDAWMKTIDGALSLDADTFIPGHGAISKRADLVQWKGQFETMRTRLRDLTRKGTPKDQVAGLLKLEDFGWPAPSGLFLKSLPAFYDEMARAR